MRPLHPWKIGHNVPNMSPRAKPRNATCIPAASAELRKLREYAGFSQEMLAEKAGYDRKTIVRWELGEQLPREGVIAYLRGLLGMGRAHVSESIAPFSFIDLFAGIGGFRMGFEAIGGRCVFTCEWDKYSQQTYRANFGQHVIHGDITKIEADSVPPHDVLLAGFPCQPFSLAGVSKKNSLGRPHGFDCSTQGTLFFEIERIIAAHRPRAFLLENVKNLQSHDSGNTFRTIMNVLRKKLGYYVTSRVIDARCFVPQHRERIFIVGFREDTPFDWSMVATPPKADWPTLSAILHSSAGSEEPEVPYTDTRGRVNSKYVLSDQLWRYLQDYAAKHRARGNGFGYGLVGPGDASRTLSARYFKDGSEILVQRREGNPRRLTPRECARLMGFDKPGRTFRIPVSDTQAYRQFGNAVAVPVVEAVARAMRPFLSGGHATRDQFTLNFALAHT
jgi:DNA (cytosine-5)-methyltransferase 1